MDSYLDAEFPLRGVSLEREFAGQSSSTTPVGQNVRVFEPSSFRGRGGSRPGLSRFIDQQVSGSNLIQHLNTVVRASASAVPVPALDPIPPTLVIDPSSPGPPDVWGTGTLYVDGNGVPVTGQTLGSRVPAPPGHHRKVREKGTGYPSYKNTLTESPPVAPSARGCFQGIIAIRVTAPSHPEWNGAEPAFVGIGCVFYQPPLQPAPPSAIIIPASPVSNTNPPVLGAETLIQYIRRWLTFHAGSDSFGKVIGDAITDPSIVVSGGCAAGNNNCQAGPPVYTPSSPSIGLQINAA